MHTHRFEAKHHQRLDSSYRRRILPPVSTLKKFGLKKGMSVADIGAGTGYFLFPASKIAGTNADVYAVDSSKEMLSMLERKKLPTNVRLIYTMDGYSFDIKSGQVDYVIASAILHENEPVRFLKEIRRVMRPGAKLLIVEWRKESLRAGPPMEERLSPEDVQDFLLRSRLRVAGTAILNARYFVVMAAKS
ncbi:MAG: class I SAM-dependent methyltransferase [Candidatus Kryptoniota bacterium]